MCALTGYPNGTFAMKLHGQNLFNEIINVEMNYSEGTIKISARYDYGFTVKLYKIL